METVINNKSNNQFRGRESSQDNTSETVSNSQLPALNTMVFHTLFEKELTSLINKYSIEKESDTPDFILAKYLIACLRNYERIINERENWFKG